MTMSEPLPDGVPTASDDAARLDVSEAEGSAIDLDSGAVAAEHAGVGAGPVSHRRIVAEPTSRASRRSDASAQQPSYASVLDHPALLVGLSVLAVIALVIGLDRASQGQPLFLVPAAILIAGYVVVVRRRRRTPSSQRARE